MRDKQKQRQWIKEHYEDFVGLRPTCCFNVYTVDMVLITVTTNDFLYGGRKNKPYNLFGSALLIHVPRSLCRRARIQVNVETGRIVSKRNMTYANK